MNRYERVLVYTAISALLALNGVFFLSHTGRTAFAEAASMIAETLGPASSLKLTDDGKEVTVRAKAGRVTWGDGDFKQTYSVAFVDIGRAMNPLMESSQFVEEREALRRELEVTEKDYQSRLEGLGEQLRRLDRDNPQTAEKMEEYRRLYGEYAKWGQEVAIPRRDALDVKHIQQAYKELAAAVNVVADKLGIDIVLRFIPADKEFKATNAEQSLNEVRLRTAVKAPEKLDITAEVLEELSVQERDR